MNYSPVHECTLTSQTPTPPHFCNSRKWSINGQSATLRGPTNAYTGYIFKKKTFRKLSILTLFSLLQFWLQFWFEKRRRKIFSSSFLSSVVFIRGSDMSFY
ncbi:cytochrome c oxidase subunit VIb [Histoplasma capsulatum var. duboisii H88]|uniref:Cytochrome c oxidase subunit VIb n=1 Tax=Ajellomyces capsulatus (strain H88) TaxID=544711 RepID=A0A8A1LY65_AJEC8|nr:cytochrome c oxidase subunit VIb [Histoplasma capsulatum var. duboisii H88]